jgi:hypothetical protein
MARNLKQKTVYQLARDEMDISREKASELTGLEPYRIERIENEKMEGADFIRLMKGDTEPVEE